MKFGHREKIEGKRKKVDLLIKCEYLTYVWAHQQTVKSKKLTLFGHWSVT